MCYISTSDSMTMGRYGKRYQPKVLLEALMKLDYDIVCADKVSSFCEPSNSMI